MNSGSNVIDLMRPLNNILFNPTNCYQQCLFTEHNTIDRSIECAIALKLFAALSICTSWWWDVYAARIWATRSQPFKSHFSDFPFVIVRVLPPFPPFRVLFLFFIFFGSLLSLAFFSPRRFFFVPFPFRNYSIRTKYREIADWMAFIVVYLFFRDCP